MSMNGSGTLAGSVPLGTLGEHAGHRVHPHDHRAQDHEKRLPEDWCSGKWLCQTCRSDELPCGTWFSGPKCSRPVPVKDGQR